MKEKEDCEKYVVLYRKCVKRILSVDIIMACLFLLTAFISAAAAIFLSTMVVSVIVLNNVEPTDVMQGGIWRLGMKQGKEYSLFLKVFLEECNRNNWEILEEGCSKYRFGKKLLEAISHKEPYNINNHYEIYNRKMKLIYQ